MWLSGQHKDNTVLIFSILVELRKSVDNTSSQNITAKFESCLVRNHGELIVIKFFEDVNIKQKPSRASFVFMTSLNFDGPEALRCLTSSCAGAHIYHHSVGEFQHSQ